MPNITNEEVTRLIESVENVQRELTNAIRSLNERSAGQCPGRVGGCNSSNRGAEGHPAELSVA
jgi:hypothetical protein